MPTKKRCPGTIYRFVENAFINNKGEIVSRNSFRPLRKKSCKGCSGCDWQREFPYDMPEDLEALFYGRFSTMKLYYLDWVDEESVEMLEYKEDYASNA